MRLAIVRWRDRVGALLLNGKWEAAARLIMRGHANDQPDIAAARAAFLDCGAPSAEYNQRMARMPAVPQISSIL